jgi:23S rRNA (cytosine1962-C5)-methyltransferase
MLQLFLKPSRDLPIRRGHPWIFSGAIERCEGDDQVVDVADIYDNKKNWIGRGLHNPKSQLRVRLLTWNKQPIDQSFFSTRLAQALTFRSEQLGAATNAYRLINGEGDFLPGLIVDRYADYFVCQFYTAGMESLKKEIIAALIEIAPMTGIFERSEGRVREEEGLEPAVGVLAGIAPPETIGIEENGRKFLVDIRRGQKTGFFLDQRDSRQFLSTLAQRPLGSELLCLHRRLFCLCSRGFAKQVVTFDSSLPALELAEKNLELNGYADAPGEVIKGDAFAYLKESDSKFDVIVLDPPSLAHRRGDLDAATGGYKF